MYQYDQHDVSSDSRSRVFNYLLFLPFVFLSFYFNLNLIKISICRALPHRLNCDNCLIIIVSGFIKYRLIITISGIFNLLFWRRSAHHKLFLSGKDIKGICEHVTQRLCLSFSIATDNCLFWISLHEI